MIAVYIRVSTVQQNIESQQREIQRWLDGHGHDAMFYVDKSTGTTTDRAQLQALQADVFAGRVTTIVVYKLDRLSRSLKDGLNILIDWLERGVRVVSVTQQLDFAAGTGKLIASVLFAIAEMENEVRAERQAAGIAAAKSRGVYSGRKSGTTKAKPQRAKQLAASGLVRREIASAMGVSERTVTRYLSA